MVAGEPSGDLLAAAVIGGLRAQVDGLQIAGIGGPRMEAQGFVERRADAEDARLTKVYLTETGRSTVERINASIQACDALATRGFSEKEIRTAVRLLKAIDHNLLSGSPADEIESDD